MYFLFFSCSKKCFFFFFSRRWNVFLSLFSYSQKYLTPFWNFFGFIIMGGITPIFLPNACPDIYMLLNNDIYLPWYLQYVQNHLANFENCIYFILRFALILHLYQLTFKLTSTFLEVLNYLLEYKGQYMVDNNFWRYVSNF